jgi:hypothetical protein
MDTIRNIGSDVFVVPLSSKFNRNYMGLDANGEVPVGTKWVDGSSINYVMEKPTVGSREADEGVQSVAQRVLNPMDFMRGGGIG